MADHRRALGAEGEDLIAAWYEARGYTVLVRNWRRRDGEIDLIVRQGRTYVFCEVKTRSSEVFGAPAESVTALKRARLRHLAAAWLSEDAPGPARQIRFDVGCVMVGAATATGERVVSVEVIEGAF